MILEIHLQRPKSKIEAWSWRARQSTQPESANECRQAIAATAIVDDVLLTRISHNSRRLHLAFLGLLLPQFLRLLSGHCNSGRRGEQGGEGGAESLTGGGEEGGAFGYLPLAGGVPVELRRNGEEIQGVYIPRR